MSIKDNIALLLTPNGFWDERPAMTTFMENEVQEGIFTAFNLINAECSNLPYKVLEYNAPHLKDSSVVVDNTNDYYRNDYELEQFRQAIITQTQYTLNMGNDFSQGSSTLSTGGMSATVQRPEKRDIIAPGVLKFLQNARLYQLQVYTSATQKTKANSCDELGRLLTIDTGDIRYVKTYQENATAGQVAYINDNKQVSFANPSELSFNVLKAQQVLDRDGQYREIKDVQNLAWFGNQGTDAMTRTEIDFEIKANKQYDENYNYMNEDIVWTWNESTRFLDYWKSKQDNNKGHPPTLDNNGYWWEKIFNRDVRAKYILDPIDNIYKTINQFDVHYFGGMSKDEIYSAINASGTSWNPDTIYAKGFVVIFVDSTNALEWYESLQDNNQGHNPETDSEWWKKLPTPAIDVNDVVNQIKPYIKQIVSDDIDAKIEAYKTSITTDFAGSEYYFADEQAFQQFLQNNPKLQSEWFDDVPSVDLSNYAKLDSANTYTGRNTFNAIVDINAGIQINSRASVNNSGIDVQGQNGYIAFYQPTSLLMLNKSTLDVRDGSTFKIGTTDNSVVNPTQDENIANKKYVDDEISNLQTQINNKAGVASNNNYTGINNFNGQTILNNASANSITFEKYGYIDLSNYGNLKLSLNTVITDSNQAVHKQYVDSLTTNITIKRIRINGTSLSRENYYNAHNYGTGIHYHYYYNMGSNIGLQTNRVVGHKLIWKNGAGFGQTAKYVLINVFFTDDNWIDVNFWLDNVSSSTVESYPQEILNNIIIELLYVPQAITLG